MLMDKTMTSVRECLKNEVVSLYQGVARAGGGKAIFVTISGNQRLQTKMMGLLHQATQAFVDDVQISWSKLPAGISCMTQVPEKPAPVFNGEQLLSYTILMRKPDTACNVICPTSKEATTTDKTTTTMVDTAHTKEGVAVLTGKIGKETISHELKVKIEETNTKDDHETNKMAFHRLAAKSLIKQLEMKLNENDGVIDSRHGMDRWSDLGEDDEEEEKQDKNDKNNSLMEEKVRLKEEHSKKKREIIVISTSSNIISRFTAFVGVDPSTKDKNVEAKVKVIRKNVWSESSCMAVACSFSRVLGANDYYGCDIDSDDDEEVCYTELSNCEDVVDALGEVVFESESKRIKCATPSSSDDEDLTQPSKPSTTMTGDSLLDLIALQHFDGSWDPEMMGFYNLVAAIQELGAALEEKCRIFCCISAKENDVIDCRLRNGTALAIVSMRVYHSSRHEEWKMIEEKALDWLTAQMSMGDQEVTELLESAEKVFKI